MTRNGRRSGQSLFVEVTVEAGQHAVSGSGYWPSRTKGCTLEMLRLLLKALSTLTRYTVPFNF